MLEEILAYNKQFVENKGYESYITNKYLSIGDSFNVTGILAGISIGVVVMFILKFVVQRRERNQNNSAT